MNLIDIHTHIGNILGDFEITLSEKIIYPLTKAYEFFEFKRFRYEVYESKILKHFSRAHNKISVLNAKLDILERSMDKNSIDFSIIAPVEPYTSAMDNLTICQNKENFGTYASINFRSQDRVEKIEALMKMGCIGLKIHPILQVVHPGDKSVFEVLEAFEQFKKPVLFHSGISVYSNEAQEISKLGAIENYTDVIRNFPKINFIMGHMGMMQNYECLALASVHGNVYLETSFQSPEIIRLAAQKIGAERILFGSDFPFNTQKTTLSIVKKAFSNNDPDLEKVIYKNAYDLFDLRTINPFKT